MQSHTETSPRSDGGESQASISILDMPSDHWWKRPFDKSKGSKGRSGKTITNSGSTAFGEEYSFPPIVTDEASAHKEFATHYTRTCVCVV